MTLWVEMRNWVVLWKSERSKDRVKVGWEEMATPRAELAAVVEEALLAKSRIRPARYCVC